MNARRRQLIDEDLLAAALEQVREVYRDLKTRRFERDCLRRTDCCRFKLTGLTPYLTRGEALVAALALRASGSTALTVRQDGQDGACPVLDEAGACRIYEARPLGCHTHFCDAAGGPYQRRQVLDLIVRLEAVDQMLGGQGAQALPVALQLAMATAGARRPRQRDKKRR